MMVYLVEDSLLVRERLRDGIREIDPGIGVCESDSARDAVAAILDGHPDIVVLDLKLAEGSGLDVLKKVRKEGSLASVVVFSNHAETQYRRRCMAMGADHFFDKTKDFGSVLEVIRDCRQKQQGNR